MRRRTIVLIGAGSAEFTTGLLADLMVSGSPWDVRLVDISEENLEVAHGVASRMLEMRPADIVLSRTTDRTEALAGADAVVTTIAVGGRRAWETDVFVPRKYGIFQPVGDTIMPGGISRALRMIPPLVDIANDMKALAPDAWLFNYSNPMAANCRGIRKATGVPVVGLCHGVMGTARTLARLADVPLEEATYTCIGINHLSWFTSFEARGKDAFPAIQKRIDETVAMDEPPERHDRLLFSGEMMKVFGAFPGVMDRHITEFFPQFFREGAHYGYKLGVDRFSFEGTIENGDKAFKRMADQAEGREPIDPAIFERAEGEHEQLVDILDHLDSDEPRVFSVNVPNDGQVENLGPDFYLECPAKVSSAGFEPLPLGRIPTGLAATVEHALRVMELSVEAALECDRSKFVQALILDGSVKSVTDAEKLADELLAAQREHLPGW